MQCEVILTSIPNTDPEDYESALDKKLKRMQQRESDAHWTLAVPDFAMPETIPNNLCTARFGCDVRRHNEAGFTSANVTGPWTKDMLDCNTIFTVRMGRDNVVEAVTGMKGRKLLNDQIVALRSIVPPTEQLSGWREGSAPPISCSQELAQMLDKAVNKYMAKENFSETVLSNAVKAINAFKYAVAAPLFFDSQPLYHWCNIGKTLPFMSVGCVHFLLSQYRDAGPSIGFARPLRATAIALGYKWHRFHFPVARYQVYERAITEDVMQTYGETNREVWKTAYYLFYEFLTRIYSEGHNLAPWDESPVLKVNAMGKDRKPLTGACCVALQQVKDKQIPHTAAALQLLDTMGCIQVLRDRDDREVVYAPSMREAEESMASIIATVNERAMKGHMPALRGGAAELFEKICEDSFYTDGRFAFNDEQLQAIKSIILNGFSVIIGAGGTGKTSITDFLIDKIFAGSSVMIAAPTCAATSRCVGSRDMAKAGRTVQHFRALVRSWLSRLSPQEKRAAEIVETDPFDMDDEELRKKIEALGVKYGWMRPHATRHALHTWQDKEGGEACEPGGERWKNEFQAHFPLLTKKVLRRRGEYEYEFKQPYPLMMFEVVIIDEGAMCSEIDLLFIESMVKYGFVKRVVMIGDVKQVGPIGAGKPLRTIIEKRIKGCNVVKLVKNHRVNKDNKSVLKNCEAWARNDPASFTIDAYSRILFRCDDSVLWLVAQIAAASEWRFDAFVGMTNKVFNSQILNAAAYVVFILKKAHAHVCGDFSILLVKLRKLLAYLVAYNADPWVLGAAETVQKSAAYSPVKNTEEEVAQLSSLKIRYAADMRISYKINNPAVKVSSNKQLVIYKFVDVTTEYVKAQFGKDGSFYAGSSAFAAQCLGNAHIESADKVVAYPPEVMRKHKIEREYENHLARPREIPNPITRCMLYRAHMPHAMEPGPLMWLPISLQSLRLNSNNVAPAWFRPVNSMQGNEEEDTYYVPDLPESILPKGKKDAWIYAEHPYTAASRTQNRFTLAVHRNFATNAPHLMRMADSCIFTETVSSMRLGGGTLFGLKDFIKRESPLPVTLLPQFVDSALHDMLPVMDKSGKCACNDCHDFTYQLLKLLEVPAVTQKRPREDAAQPTRDDEPDSDDEMDTYQDLPAPPVNELTEAVSFV